MSVAGFGEGLLEGMDVAFDMLRIFENGDEENESNCKKIIFL